MIFDKNPLVVVSEVKAAETGSTAVRIAYMFREKYSFRDRHGFEP
jgi:hypothetical protein